MKKAKLLFVLLDIVAVAVLVFSYIKYREEKMEQKPTETKTGNTVDKVSYKHFEFGIPTDISFKVEDYDSFSLVDSKNKAWEAYISIFYDPDKKILNNPQKYQEYLKSNMQYSLGEIENITISNTKFNACKRYRGDSDFQTGIIGIADFHGKYVYQIDFISLKDNFNVKDAIPVVEIIENSVYKNDTDEVYYYKPYTKIVAE